MKLWHDDERQPPVDPSAAGWTWANSNRLARKLLSENEFDEISLDHDMGGNQTGLALVRWMIAEGRVPRVITIHSWHAGRAREMAATLNDAGHDVTLRPYGAAA